MKGRPGNRREQVSHRAHDRRIPARPIPRRDRPHRAGPLSARDSDTIRQDGGAICSCRRFRFTWPVELCPGWLYGPNGNAPSLDRRTGSERIPDPVESHEGETMPFGGRAKRTDLPVTRHDRQAGTRRKFVIDNRHDAAACAGTMLHAGYDLLTDIAALAEIDAVELIHVCFVRKRIAINEIEAAARNTERDTVSLVGVCADQLAAEIGGGFLGKMRRQHHPRTERRQTWVGIAQAIFAFRSAVPDRHDPEYARQILANHLCPQL